MFKNTLWSLIVTLALFSGCGGAASGPSTPTDIPIALEGVEGSTDVNVSSSFSYTFSKAVETSTVTTTTFYMVKGDSDDCDPDDAIDASVECESETVCTLDPTDDLTKSVEYTACLEAGTSSASISPAKQSSMSGIFYADGEAFAGDTITFTTAADVTAVECSEVYSSDDCTYEGNLEEGVTITYTDFETLAAEYLDDTGFLLCLCQLASDAGETGCMTIGAENNATCNIVTSPNEDLSWGAGIADGDSITLDSLNSTTIAFTSSVTMYDSSQYSDISNGYYVLLASETDDSGVSPAVGGNICDGLDSCTYVFSEGIVGVAITQIYTNITADNWNDTSRCVEVVLQWVNYIDGDQTS
ncbi:MAG: hypothetical protein HN337_00670, partial [Deltaproteobacteria bacterium]|nr:hypothetical protein [Deltaproteobacteria bacterium]